MTLTQEITKSLWHGAEGEARRILFVCTGNTCRSPMAAAILNDMARERGVCSLGATKSGQARIVAASAGLYAHHGAPISREAVDALREAGVAPLPDNDYTAHTAATVTEQMIKEADEVVAISASHAMELMMRFPEHISKIVTLQSDIPDPFGRGLAAYRTCLATLSYCITLRYFGGEERV